MNIFFERIIPDDYKLFISNELWLEAIAMAADDALIQAMRKSCGWLCSNKCFITVDHISVMCCNLRYFTY